MPELPEVETIVRQLQSKILSKTITSLQIYDRKVIDQQIKKILPSKITNIYRRGKSIIVQLEKNNNLLIQLRMTGHFYHIIDNNPGSQNYRKFLSGIFNLNDNSFLTFNEIRRFGSVRLFNDQELKKELSKLGPEPLLITTKKFVKLIKKYPAATIKTKLLDQTGIAGIGNIYAQEALYHAGVHPLKKVKDVSDWKLLKLHQEIQRTLQLAIENNGTTVENFSHLTGKGNFQNFLAVYNREVCPKGHSVEKLRIGGRGTSYCRVCQK